MKISVPEHTLFYSGYLDAIGRLYTNDRFLYGLSASVIPKESSLESELSASVVEVSNVPNMVGHFEQSISKLLNIDPREKLIFYLVEYFQWFEEYTASCVCKSYKINGKNIPDKYMCYVLNVNNEFNVLIYFCALKQGINNG